MPSFCAGCHRELGSSVIFQCGICLLCAKRDVPMSPKEWWGQPCSPQFNPSECDFCIGLKRFAEKKRDAENSEEAKQKKIADDEEQIRIAREYVKNEKSRREWDAIHKEEERVKKRVNKMYGRHHTYGMGGNP